MPKKPRKSLIKYVDVILSIYIVFLLQLRKNSGIPNYKYS